MRRSVSNKKPSVILAGGFCCLGVWYGFCDNMDDIGKAVDWKEVDNRIEEIKNKSIGYLKGLKSLGNE